MSRILWTIAISGFTAAILDYWKVMDWSRSCYFVAQSYSEKVTKAHLITPSGYKMASKILAWGVNYPPWALLGLRSAWPFIQVCLIILMTAWRYSVARLKISVWLSIQVRLVVPVTAWERPCPTSTESILKLWSWVRERVPFICQAGSNDELYFWALFLGSNYELDFPALFLGSNYQLYFLALFIRSKWKDNISSQNSKIQLVLPTVLIYNI